MEESAALKFRQATLEDALAIRALTRAAYAQWVPLIGREPLPMAADYELAIRTNRFDLLEHGGELVALLETIPRSDHLWVENLAVAPSRHGQGLGRRMLRLAEDVANSLGQCEIKLVTAMEFTGNVDFYLRAGFEVEREEPFKGCVAVYLRKSV